MTRYRGTLVALLVFIALSLLLTWPLPLHLATHAPGDGSDDPAILWNLWWVRYSLTELGQSPFESAWMFWPIGINLVFYTLTTLNALLSIPLQLALGIVPANSFIVYFELVIAALGTWLLARWLLAQHPDAAPHSRRTRDTIALLSACVFAFSTSRWQYLSLGQFNIAASHWFPWAVLYLARMWAATTWRRGLRETALCALFVLFSGWTEFTYASFFIQFAALFWLWHILADLRHGNRANAIRYTKLCAALGLLFLVGMSPILWLMAQDLRASGDFLVEGLGFANVFSNDLLGFFVPGDTHPLFGAWVRDGFDFAYLNFAFLGWGATALAVVALAWRGTRRYAASWASIGALFALLSLGPTLRVNGREWELPLPFDVLLQLPIVKANRYPSRYSVIIALCLAMLVAWGLSALARRMESRAPSSPRFQRVVAPLVLLLLLGEHMGMPLPLSDYRVPEVYHALHERAGAAVLEMPLAWRNGFRVTGVHHNAFMFAQAFQTTHEKRLLNGNTSRNPEIKFQYFTEMPVINSLLALETGKPLPEGRAEQDAALAGDLLRLLDAPNIVVRRLNADNPAVTPEAALPYLESILGTARWHEDDEYVGLEATLPPAPEQITWDGTHPLARLFFAEGWSALPPLDNTLPPDANWPLYAEQEEARLLVPTIASEGAWSLTFETWLPEGLETPVTLLAADPAGGASLPLATLTLSGEQTHQVTLPPGAARGSLTEIVFRFGATHPAGAFLDGAYPVGTTGAALPVSLLVESAEEDTGKFAHIYVNGVDVAGNGTGYHAALLSPRGEVLAVEYFNTFADPAVSTRLAAFIEQAAPGTIVALAAEDTVSAGEGTGGARLSDEVFAALETVGASPASDMRGRFRWSHAFVGVKGAPAGRALEDSSPIRPARVTVGPALHSPTVAARFDRFHLEPATSAAP
ncbi:MAG TPA: interleukin-like EMT inducer domain-containing protein [Ardenticatenaceae bacterium]